MEGEYQSDSAVAKEPQIELSTCATDKSVPWKNKAYVTPNIRSGRFGDFVDSLPSRNNNNSTSCFNRNSIFSKNYRVKNAYHFSNDQMLEYMPEHPYFASYFRRLCTFQDWSKQMKQSPEEMAKSGFFYTGQSDKCTCFHCNVTLYHWEYKDSAIKEHKDKSPNCVFLEMTQNI